MVCPKQRTAPSTTGTLSATPTQTVAPSSSPITPSGEKPKIYESEQINVYIYASSFLSFLPPIREKEARGQPELGSLCRGSAQLWMITEKRQVDLCVAVQPCCIALISPSVCPKAIADGYITWTTTSLHDGVDTMTPYMRWDAMRPWRRVLIHPSLLLSWNWTSIPHIEPSFCLLIPTEILQWNRKGTHFGMTELYQRLMWVFKCWEQFSGNNS